MINWIGLFLIGLLWILGVLLVIGVLSLLFPPMKRQNSEHGLPATGLLPWYPTPKTPRIDTQIPKTSPPIQPANPAYWRANRRLIGLLLAIWLGISVGSVLLSPILNQFRVLTGFPLGYFMGSQGVLLIFLLLIAIYVWRGGQLDRQYYPEPENGNDNSLNGAAKSVNSWRIGLILLCFALGFGLLLMMLGSLEAAHVLPAKTAEWMLFAVTIGVYAIVGLSSRAHTLDDYFVAGRRIPPFFNGMAIAGDWMSAASFISMAGTLWLLGYEGLAYIMGWTGGYVLLSMLIAPYLRKFGQYTIPDFIAARYNGNTARIIAAMISIIISFTYITAQVAGVGIIMSRFLGVNYYIGVFVGLGSVLFCSFLGGMRAITWTQVLQCIVLLMAYLVPVTMLSWRETGVPLPQLMYGAALENIVHLEQIHNIGAGYITPFNDWSVWNFVALMLCLMCGTAGMPHILVRFYTVPTASDARRSTGWALVFILLLYLTAPAYAAFSRWEVLKNMIGKPIQALPEWASTWAQLDLIKFEDQNNDGILQFSELSINPDLIVVSTPDIAELPRSVGALVAAGGLSAALSTADGLLLVIASAFAHDIYSRIINPRASLRNRFLLGRIAVLIAAVLASLTALRRLAIIVQLVSWAFSLAASTLFPVLVLGIFWKRTNGTGAIAGMLTGLVVTLSYMMINFAYPTFNILGIQHIAAGIFGIPANFLVTILISKLTPPPSQDAIDLVEGLRQP